MENRKEAEIRRETVTVISQ